MQTAQITNTSLFVKDDSFQTQINLFLKDLKEMGYTEEKIEKILENTISQVETELEMKILATMTPKDIKNWKEFQNTNPNPSQEFITMNRFLENRKGKSIEQLQEEILEKQLKETIEILKFTNEILPKIEKLDPQTVSKAQGLIDQGLFNEAKTLIDNSSNLNN